MASQGQQAAQPDAPRLLWNPENVKDVAESVGISQLSDEAQRALSQDVEYRLGQLIVEALRFMRAASRTTLTVQDMSLALRVLDVEPLYGYESTRPVRYGEASLGPGQPLFYIEDEEMEFEKIINAPLPKVPRDTSFTGTVMPATPLWQVCTANVVLFSSLACRRWRPALDSSKSHDCRIPLQGTPSKGPGR